MDARSAYELAVAGDDEILWLIVGSQENEQQQFLQSLAYLDPATARARVPLRIEQQKGHLTCWTAVGEGLHLIFSNGAHYRYTRTRGRVERQLPHRMVPKAIGGQVEGSRSVLWAVVDAKTANAVEKEWQDMLSRRATRPAQDQPSPGSAEGAPLPESRSIDRPEGTYHLVQYDGVCWQPGFAAPGECSPGSHFWLCVFKDEHHLFWQRTAGAREIHHARYNGNEWAIEPAVKLSEPPYVSVAADRQQHFAGAIAEDLFFVALVMDPHDPQQVRCEPWVFKPGPTRGEPGQWQPCAAPQTEDKGNLALASGSAVGAFDGKLVLMRMGREKAEFGLWPTTGGPPERAFAEVPVRPTDDGSPRQRGIRDFAAMLIVAALLMLVFWRRQSSVTLPMALPAGIELAGAGKRALAAAIDLAPATAVVMWWWYDPMIATLEDLRAAAQASREMENLATPRELVWAWVWFRVIYTGYCMLFELLLAATPGKRLLGCEVLAETLARPNVAQITIRNLARLVELEPSLQIWPFMLVIFLTRNRQRIGDLLARTIVVQRQGTILDADEGPDERGND